MKEKFEKCLSLLREMNGRQAKFFTVTKQIEEKAARTAVELGTVAPQLEQIPAYKKEWDTTVEDMVRIKEQLIMAVNELESAHEARKLECPNLNSTELANALKIIDLTGKDFSRAQAINFCSGFKGDYMTLNTIAAALRRAENDLSAQAVEHMIPNIPALCDDIRKRCDPSNLIQIVKADTARMRNMLLSAAEKLDIKINDSEPLIDYFEEELWRAEAGL